MHVRMLESGTVVDRVCIRDKKCGRERKDRHKAKEWGTTPETD